MWTLITNAIKLLYAQGLALGPVLIYRILTGIGIGYGVYSFALPYMVGFVQSYLNSLEPWAVQLLGALKVDVGLTIIFSAYAAKLGIRVRAIKLDTQGGNP
jgi:hypothetical protein